MRPTWEDGDDEARSGVVGVTTPPPGQWPPPPSPQGPPPWGPRPTAPRSGSASKWILGSLALLVVVVITVVATIFLTHDSPERAASDTSNPPNTSGNSEVASASDRTAVGIITQDPTCVSWEPIAKALSERQANGWDNRDPRIPASGWSPEQRSYYEAVGDAMRTASDQTVALARQTPHRVMRELYEQSIAYWRAYADSLKYYSPEDDSLALVASGTSGALVWICAAINYGSAEARDALVPPGSPPLAISPPNDPAEPVRFLEEPSPVCRDWSVNIERFDAATDSWANSLDPAVPGSQWTPEVQSLAAQMTVVFQENAGQLQNMGVTSGNPILNDFASLAARYQRAYVQSLASYNPADNFLNSVAADLVVAVDNACRAASG